MKKNMKKMSSKMLTLARQTIRTLQSDDLCRVRGGDGETGTCARPNTWETVCQ